MGFYLETFTTWLRQAKTLSDDIEILSDRAAIPKDRKRRPTTRWDHLVKQQSFSMPKVPSRRRLSITLEEDTATDSCPVPTRIMNQVSLSYPPRGGTGRRTGSEGDEGAARPGLGAKQTSLRSLPRHQRSLNSLTEVEQMKMPRLVKQKSFSSIRRGLSDDDQSTGRRRCMEKQNSFSLPNRPSQTHQRELSRRPKLSVCTHDSKSDENSDTLSSMPRLVKQTSFTVARLSSRAPLICNDEKGANGTHQHQQMVKSDSLRRPIKIFDIDNEVDERTDTLSSMPRLVKETSFTVARHSSRGALIGDDAKGENVVKPNSPFSSPRSPIRTSDSDDESDTRAATLASMPCLAKQTSFTILRLSSGTLELGDDESDDESNTQSNSDATPESSPHESGNIQESKSTTDLPPNFDATPESSPHNSGEIVHESKSTSDLPPRDLSPTCDVNVVIGTKLGSSLVSSESPARQHLRLLGQSKAVDCIVESAEWTTFYQREHLYTA